MVERLPAERVHPDVNELDSFDAGKENGVEAEVIGEVDGSFLESGITRAILSFLRLFCNSTKFHSARFW